jgi:hypothetical protein
MRSLRSSTCMTHEHGAAWLELQQLVAAAATRCRHQHPQQQQQQRAAVDQMRTWACAVLLEMPNQRCRAGTP